jgi:hypothetical protein
MQHRQGIAVNSGTHIFGFVNSFDVNIVNGILLKLNVTLYVNCAYLSVDYIIDSSISYKGIYTLHFLNTTSESE